MINDPYDIRLRQDAIAENHLDIGALGIAVDVPERETWVFWAASMVNNTRAANPYIVTYPTGFNAPQFIWPTVSVGSGPPGAGEYGSIVDPAWYPQIVQGGGRILIRDNDYVAGDVVDVYLLKTIVQKEDYYG